MQFWSMRLLHVKQRMPAPAWGKYVIITAFVRCDSTPFESTVQNSRNTYELATSTHCFRFGGAERGRSQISLNASQVVTGTFPGNSWYMTLFKFCTFCYNTIETQTLWAALNSNYNLNGKRMYKGGMVYMFNNMYNIICVHCIFICKHLWRHIMTSHVYI